jgi:hypothetical protein
MKAEHRRELETNFLADRMGRLVHTIKERPKKRAFLYVVGSVIVVGILLLVYNYFQQQARERSDRWQWLEDGMQYYMESLRQDPQSNPGKAARFQIAWINLWDAGIMRLGARDKDSALKSIARAEDDYKSLSAECAGDPIWEPEARYALAIIEETKAIRQKDRKKHLERAQTLFKKLADDYPDSAFGKKAKARAEILKNNLDGLMTFYDDLQVRLRIPEEDIPIRSQPDTKP